jgi:hypothetical protein
MTITEIFDQYTQGSQGFCIAVETHCGYDISRDEIERIAGAAETAADFHRIWADDFWWTDEAAA